MIQFNQFIYTFHNDYRYTITFVFNVFVFIAEVIELNFLLL